jgi:hypothetical protein
LNVFTITREVKVSTNRLINNEPIYSTTKVLRWSEISFCNITRFFGQNNLLYSQFTTELTTDDFSPLIVAVLC